mmetsp:Transcript_42001/g.94884  ORF Transcript_42001/g.94884 Transcript_42001/m.94884 type:complete len:294 (+) Transcript_42001:2012-2893(+)
MGQSHQRRAGGMGGVRGRGAKGAAQPIGPRPRKGPRPFQGAQGTRAGPLQAFRDRSRPPRELHLEVLRLTRGSHHGPLRHVRVHGPADLRPALELPAGLLRPATRGLRDEARLSKRPRPPGRGRDLVPRAARDDGLPGRLLEDPGGAGPMGRVAQIRGCGRGDARRIAQNHRKGEGAFDHGGGGERGARANRGRPQGPAPLLRQSHGRRGPPKVPEPPGDALCGALGFVWPTRPALGSPRRALQTGGPKRAHRPGGKGIRGVARRVAFERRGVQLVGGVRLAGAADSYRGPAR